MLAKNLFVIEKLSLNEFTSFGFAQNTLHNFQMPFCLRQMAQKSLKSTKCEVQFQLLCDEITLKKKMFVLICDPTGQIVYCLHPPFL